MRIGFTRYRTVAPSAQVDKSLFGNNIMLDKRGKTNPSGEFAILSPSECQRIRSAAQFNAKDEKNAYQRAREEEYKAGEVMRRRIIDIENIRQQNMPPSQKELKAREHSKKMRERANTLRMMQEDEVKELNTVFLAVQCQETREAQIAENRRSQAELAEEEKLLSAWREKERLKALEAIWQADELHKQKEKSLWNHNCNQISQNIQNKQVLNEMERQERQKVEEREEKMTLKHRETLEQNREKLQRLQKDNEDLIARRRQAKKQRMEEERLADIKDKEFIQKKMKQKAEQEAAWQRKKKERELEIAKLLAQQEKDKDNKAEQDRLHAKRIQEIKDREWRRKEKDAAAKKVQDEVRMRTAHCEQLTSRDHVQAVEVTRQKEVFDRVLKASQDTNSKHKEEEEKQRKKAANYLQALEHQIKENDHSAATKRQKVLKEAQDLIDLGKQRRVRLDQFKQNQVKEMKATGVSEKYYSALESKVNNQKTLQDQRARDKTRGTEGTLLNTIGQVMHGGTGSERQSDKYLNVLAAEEEESKRQDRQHLNVRELQQRQSREKELPKINRLSDHKIGNMLPRPPEAYKPTQLTSRQVSNLVQKPSFLPPIPDAVEHPFRGRVSPVVHIEESKQERNNTYRYEETTIIDLRQTRLSTSPSFPQGRTASAGQPKFRLPPIRK